MIQIKQANSDIIYLINSILQSHHTIQLQHLNYQILCKYLLTNPQLQPSHFMGQKKISNLSKLLIIEQIIYLISRDDNLPYGNEPVLALAIFQSAPQKPQIQQPLPAIYQHNDKQYVP